MSRTPIVIGTIVGIATVLVAVRGDASDSKIYNGGLCRAYGADISEVVYPDDGGGVTLIDGASGVIPVYCDITRDIIAGVVDSVKFKMWQSLNNDTNGSCTVYSVSVTGSPFPGYDSAYGAFPGNLEEQEVTIDVSDFTEYTNGTYYLRCDLGREYGVAGGASRLRLYRVQES
jgi:hypothetical protein